MCVTHTWKCVNSETWLNLKYASLGSLTSEQIVLKVFLWIQVHCFLASMFELTTLGIISYICTWLILPEFINWIWYFFESVTISLFSVELFLRDAVLKRNCWVSISMFQEALCILWGKEALNSYGLTHIHWIKVTLVLLRMIAIFQTCFT